MKTLTLTLFGLTLLALPSPGAVYDEAVQGDLRGAGKNGKPPVIRLDLGTNVVRGTTFFSTPAAFDDDLFVVRVPKGSVLQLDSTIYEYDITGMFGQIVAFGTFVGISDGVSHKSDIKYSTGDTHGPNFWLFDDGSEPTIETSPSPVSLEFFEVVNFTVDVTRPAPPLPPGDYRVISAPGYLFNGSVGAMWNYSITFIVTPAS